MIGDDLTPFFGDFAVEVIAGATAGLGILDCPTMAIGDGMVLSEEYLLMCQTAEFGGVAPYSDIQVNGEAYTVREVRRIDDGKLCEISLSKV